MYKPVKQAFPKKQHVKYGSGVFRRVVGDLIKDVILASFCTKAIFDSSMQSYFKINFICAMLISYVENHQLFGSLTKLPTAGQE